MMFNAVYVYRTCDKGGGSGEGSPEAHLIRKLQQGNLKALGTLFTTYKDIVYRTALAITRDKRTAEDI